MTHQVITARWWCLNLEKLNMNYSVILHDKPIQVEISRRAERALSKRQWPIFADINLIFGCMIAKRVWFKNKADDDSVIVTDKLSLSFHTVKYDVCSFENIDSGGVAEPFYPEKGINKFMPHYIFIDFHKFKFIGEFSFNTELKPAITQNI